MTDSETIEITTPTIAALKAEAAALGIAVTGPRISRNALREAIDEKRRQAAAYLKEAGKGENLDLFA